MKLGDKHSPETRKRMNEIAKLRVEREKKVKLNNRKWSYPDDVDESESENKKVD